MKIELPQVGESVTEGIIGRWLRQPGDRVEKYDPLVEVVTDKVSMEMPSPASGVLTRILAEEGQTVPTRAVLAEIDRELSVRQQVQLRFFLQRFRREMAQRIRSLGDRNVPPGERPGRR